MRVRLTADSVRCYLLLGLCAARPGIARPRDAFLAFRAGLRLSLLVAHGRGLLAFASLRAALAHALILVAYTYKYGVFTELC